MTRPSLGYVLAALAIWSAVAYGALAKPRFRAAGLEIACLGLR